MCVKYHLISISKCAQNARTAFNFSKFSGGACPRTPLEWLRAFSTRARACDARPHNLEKAHFFHIGPPNHFFAATSLRICTRQAMQFENCAIGEFSITRWPMGAVPPDTKSQTES